MAHLGAVTDGSFVQLVSQHHCQPLVSAGPRSVLVPTQSRDGRVTHATSNASMCLSSLGALPGGLESASFSTWGQWRNGAYQYSVVLEAW